MATKKITSTNVYFLRISSKLYLCSWYHRLYCSQTTGTKVLITLVPCMMVKFLKLQGSFLCLCLYVSSLGCVSEVDVKRKKNNSFFFLESNANYYNLKTFTKREKKTENVVNDNFYEIQRKDSKVFFGLRRSLLFYSFAFIIWRDLKIVGKREYLTWRPFFTNQSIRLYVVQNVLLLFKR